MGTIVLTTDLSEAAERATNPTLELAANLGHEVVLLHVVQELKAAPHGAPLAPPVSPPDTAERLEEMRKELDAKAAELDGDVPVSAEVIGAEDVAKAVAKFAAERGAAFLAVSTHGRSGVRHLVLGSVAEAILRHARTPVVCFPQKA